MATIKDISGVRVGALKPLQPILDNWRKLTNLESWFLEPDATWWNNERASLSIFAGAIWRCKGLVMEEFATEKIKRTQLKAGRCDIIFRVEQKVFLGEAKQDWPLLTGKNLQINLKETYRVIKQACRESLHTKDPKATHLGIVFITPRTYETNEKSLDEYLIDYLTALKRREDFTLAWQFPNWARDLRSSEEGSKKYIYPGVILLIKKAK